MRHRKAGRQLRRTSEQKLALMRNLASSLIEHGAIETTEAKAKELRPFVEKLITKARTGTLHARRLAGRHVHKRETADKLFQELGPRFAKRVQTARRGPCSSLAPATPSAQGWTCGRRPSPKPAVKGSTPARRPRLCASASGTWKYAPSLRRYAAIARSMSGRPRRSTPPGFRTRRNSLRARGTSRQGRSWRAWMLAM